MTTDEELRESIQKVRVEDGKLPTDARLERMADELDFQMAAVMHLGDPGGHPSQREEASA